jgi:hypothetical protein
MPFDGAYGKDFLLLDLLNTVRKHLSDKTKWMKSDLTDGQNRFCLVGAIMHYAQNETLADSAIGVVSKHIRKDRYTAQSPSARIMRYNDAKVIHHHHVLRMLDRAIKGLKTNARVP